MNNQQYNSEEIYQIIIAAINHTHINNKQAVVAINHFHETCNVQYFDSVLMASLSNQPLQFRVSATLAVKNYLLSKISCVQALRGQAWKCKSNQEQQTIISEIVNGMNGDNNQLHFLLYAIIQHSPNKYVTDIINFITQTAIQQSNTNLTVQVTKVINSLFNTKLVLPYHRNTMILDFILHSLQNPIKEQLLLILQLFNNYLAKAVDKINYDQILIQLLQLFQQCIKVNKNDYISIILQIFSSTQLNTFLLNYKISDSLFCIEVLIEYNLQTLLQNYNNPQETAITSSALEFLLQLFQQTEYQIIYSTQYVYKTLENLIKYLKQLITFYLGSPEPEYESCEAIKATGQILKQICTNYGDKQLMSIQLLEHISQNYNYVEQFNQPNFITIQLDQLQNIILFMNLDESCNLYNNQNNILNKLLDQLIVTMQQNIKNIMQSNEHLCQNTTYFVNLLKTINMICVTNPHKISQVHILKLLQDIVIPLACYCERGFKQLYQYTTVQMFNQIETLQLNTYEDAKYLTTIISEYVNVYRHCNVVEITTIKDTIDNIINSISDVKPFVQLIDQVDALFQQSVSEYKKQQQNIKFNYVGVELILQVLNTIVYIQYKNSVTKQHELSRIIQRLYQKCINTFLLFINDPQADNIVINCLQILSYIIIQESKVENIQDQQLFYNTLLQYIQVCTTQKQIGELYLQALEFYSYSLNQYDFNCQQEIIQYVFNNIYVTSEQNNINQQIQNVFLEILNFSITEAMQNKLNKQNILSVDQVEKLFEFMEGVLINIQYFDMNHKEQDRKLIEQFIQIILNLLLIYTQQIDAQVNIVKFVKDHLQQLVKLSIQLVIKVMSCCKHLLQLNFKLQEDFQIFVGALNVIQVIKENFKMSFNYNEFTDLIQDDKVEVYQNTDYIGVSELTSMIEKCFSEEISQLKQIQMDNKSIYEG